MSSLITSFLGALGFSLIFNIRKKLIVPAAIGGLLCWIIYLIMSETGFGIFPASMAASAFAAVYSEVLARVFKTPATVFYIPSVIPLVPGSCLYYMMNAAAFGNWEKFRYHGIETGFYVLGIACGIFFVSGVVHIITSSLKNKH